METKFDFLTEGNVEIYKTKHYNYGDGIIIRYTAMYNSPDLSLKTLKAIGEYFGTDYVDVDTNSINEPGCESCDYWSCYGHEIHVYQITKNFPAFA